MAAPSPQGQKLSALEKALQGPRQAQADAKAAAVKPAQPAPAKP